MSDTPKDPGAGSGETPEYSDPTAPVWNPGEERPDDTEGTGDVTWSTGDETRAVPAESTQQLPTAEPPPGQPTEPPAAPGVPTPYGQVPSPPQGPYGQAPNPYGQAQNPYAAGAPGGYPAARPGPPPVPGAPGTMGAGFPPGPPAQYGQPAYGQPASGQPGYGPPGPYSQGPGYAPSPYARPGGQTNTSAIALTVVSGLSTLVGCIFAIPALILGIMALVKQGASPGDAARLTRWGWIAYAVALAFVVIGGIIAIAIFASTSTSTGY
jgi:hypothetical protein